MDYNKILKQIKNKNSIPSNIYNIIKTKNPITNYLKEQLDCLLIHYQYKKDKNSLFTTYRNILLFTGITVNQNSNLNYPSITQKLRQSINLISLTLDKQTLENKIAPIVKTENPIKQFLEDQYIQITSNAYDLNKQLSEFQNITLLTGLMIGRSIKK